MLFELNHRLTGHYLNLKDGGCRLKISNVGNRNGCEQIPLQCRFEHRTSNASKTIDCNVTHTESPLFFEEVLLKQEDKHLIGKYTRRSR